MQRNPEHDHTDTSFTRSPVAGGSSPQAAGNKPSGAWDLPLEEVQREVSHAGLDVEAIGKAAAAAFLEDIDALRSRPITRRALGSYLRDCREKSQQAIHAVSRITGFSDREILAVEDGSGSIFQLLQKRESQFADWLKMIGCDGRRVVRLLRNCPSPAGWYEAPISNEEFAYHPASSDAFGAVAGLPHKAEESIERLLEALY